MTQLTQPSFLPVVSFQEIAVPEANRLLVEWGHRLGPVHRPFGMQAFGLVVDAKLVSVAVSASTVSTTVAGYRREQVVELARQCAEPSSAWANRVTIRLWREVGAHLWPYWTALAAISYSKNAHHRGDLYRFDGWQKVSEDCGSSGGGAWSRKRYATDEVHGKKTLWLWRYAPAEASRDAAA